jgi:small-conductance mechanosensitive channel
VPELTNVIFGNEIKAWLTALGIAVGLFIVLRLVEQVLIVRVQRLTKQTSTIIDDVVVGALRKTKLIYLFVVAAFLGSLALTLPESLRSTAWQVLIVATLLQAGIWVSTGLQIWLSNYTEREEDGANRTTMNALSFIVRVALWTTVILLILDNLGVDVTALVTGLGIGGVAIALAVQNVLSDLFASLSIVLDKPFVNGDFIVVGELAGSARRGQNDPHPEHLGGAARVLQQ